MKPFKQRNRLFIAPIFLAAIAGFGFITMLLWNALLPELFHLPQISFWQAVGLLILSRLLFGFRPWNGRHNHRIGHLREKWEHMSPQERDEFKRRLQQRRPLWNESKTKEANPDTSENRNS
jgi:hypothetical protein